MNEGLISRYSIKLSELACSPVTVKGYLGHLGSALSGVRDQKFIAEVPTIRTPKAPKKKRADIRIIVSEQVEWILAKADVFWTALIAAGWYTGMRRQEQLDLTWDEESAPHVDFKRKRIWLTAEYTKAVEDQWIPMHPDLVDILGRLLRRGRRVLMVEHKDNITTKVKEIVKSVGLRITPRDLRRSFGSRNATEVREPVLQRLMRHADIKTRLECYTNIEVAYTM